MKESVLRNGKPNRFWRLRFHTRKRQRAVTGSSRHQSCRTPDPGAAGALPVESWAGSGFISLSTIFWYKALRLNGSTVKGRVPVSMAYMFTPLKGETQQSVRPEDDPGRRQSGQGRGEAGSRRLRVRLGAARPFLERSAPRRDRKRGRRERKRSGGDSDPGDNRGLKSVGVTQRSLL